MNDKNYDLVVIGSGPAGEKGAAQAAYFGKKVALIEKEQELGGAAANTGTLPSKTLRETSLYLSGFRQRGLYGMEINFKDQVTARDFLYREKIVSQAERERIKTNIDRHNIDLFKGNASFIDQNTISIKPNNSKEIFIKGDVILIATGSYPFRPPNIPFEYPGVYDSDTILKILKIPKTMVVAGGGVIGCEYACMFAALGVEVTLVEGRETVLAFLDKEISDALAQAMINLGVKLTLSSTIDNVVKNDKNFIVNLDSGNSIEVENILAATGRTGATGTLNLKALELEAGSRGNLSVNENYQTSLSHVYAVGDVIGFPALASTSMEQARIAMVHAFDLKYKTSLAPILPYGIYTIPECSMAGETETSLKEKKIDYVVGRARANSNARGQIIGDKDGFTKLLFSAEDMKLLGVQIIGENASELVHIGLIGLMTFATADLFIQTCFNYPTLGEMYKYATYDALGAKQKYDLQKK
ncbi:Si-specific NAD(P)(+) transhydrogenase [Alphaproteobacteria bacterium]|nr:Si-specific NAD(P)(+) transhydrogenase [Alphaproteobacteria bacterium]